MTKGVITASNRIRMSTARQSLVPPSSRTGQGKTQHVERNYNPVKYDRLLRLASIAFHFGAVVLMGLVLLLLPESDGEDKMTVLPSVLNHADLCVGIFATCQRMTCSVQMSLKDPGGGNATGDLIAVGPLRWGLSQAYLCVFYIGLLSLLAPLLPKLLSAPKSLYWYFNDDQEKKTAFPKLRIKMKALHLQLLVLHVAMAGILLLPLGVIIQLGLAADGSSIGTGVYLLVLSFLAGLASLITLKLTENDFVTKVKKAWKAKGKALSLHWWGSVIAWPFATAWNVLTWPVRACWKKLEL